MLGCFAGIGYVDIFFIDFGFWPNRLLNHFPTWRGTCMVHAFFCGGVLRELGGSCAKELRKVIVRRNVVVLQNL